MQEPLSALERSKSRTCVKHIEAKRRRRARWKRRKDTLGNVT